MEYVYQVIVRRRKGHSWGFQIAREGEGNGRLYRLKAEDFDKLGGEFPQLRDQYRTSDIPAGYELGQTISVRGARKLEDVPLKHHTAPPAFRFSRSPVPPYSSATTERSLEPTGRQGAPASLPSRAHSEPSGLRTSYEAVLNQQTVTVRIGWTDDHVHKRIGWRWPNGDTVYGFTHAESNHPSNRSKMNFYRRLVQQGWTELRGQTLYLESTSSR